MTRQMSLLIIDDHPLFREGLKTIIGRDARFSIAGEAGEGQEGLRLALELRPDLIIVDISLPDINGIDLTREIKHVLPDSRIMIVSMHAKVHFISQAYQAGALGYITKDSAADGLLRGLEKIYQGKLFLDTALSEEVIQGLLRSGKGEAGGYGSKYSLLTSREQQIMRLLAQGHTSKQIAQQLSISPKTVDNHRTNIMNKLEVHSSLELVRYAARIGLIDVDEWKA
jgi:DNA-binding NarL/FixJ family response regulator